MKIESIYYYNNEEIITTRRTNQIVLNQNSQNDTIRDSPNQELMSTAILGTKNRAETKQQTLIRYN